MKKRNGKGAGVGVAESKKIAHLETEEAHKKRRKKDAANHRNRKQA